MYTLQSMKKEVQNIHCKFQSIMDLTLQLEKMPKRFGTDELMSISEIHMIELIGDTEDLSVTDISRHLNVTKGAVSQSLKKLEARGFVQKDQDPENRSRVIVSLTAKGQTAYWAHKHWHETRDGGFLKYLQEIKEDDLLVIVQFLERVEDFLQEGLSSPE